MSRPPRSGAELSQSAKLALLGVGTLATGAVGLLSLAAGYHMKKRAAQDPSKVSVQSYLDDLTHLIPPWQPTPTDEPKTDAAPSFSSSPASAYQAPRNGMETGFASHRDQWRMQRGVSTDTLLAEESKTRAELAALELIGAEEEAALMNFEYNTNDFAECAANLPLPLSAKSLVRICNFLPFESVVVLGSVNKSLQTFAQVLTRNAGFQMQQARSSVGFTEHLRGAIWMYISGAQTTAQKMSRRASVMAMNNFYEHMVRMCEQYRTQIVHQNSLAGTRSPSPPSVDSSSVSMSASSSSPPPFTIEGLSSDSRASLDTIMKDVPRTMVASNPASQSLISNVSGLSSASPPPVAADAASSSDTIAAVAPSSQRVLQAHLAEDLVSLTNLLSVYALSDSALGYTQGMNFVASFLLSKLPEQDAYWLFHTVMQSPKWNYRSFYVSDLHGLLVCKYQFQFLFELYLPELYAHFRAQDIHSDIFTEWFMTLFTYASFPRRYPLLDRLWDCLIVGGGTKFLHRVALSILHLSQSTLLLYEFEDIIYYLKHLPDDGILDPALILPLACDRFRVTNAALAELEKRFDAEQADANQRSPHAPNA